QLVNEFQIHTLPEEPDALGLLARRMGIARPPAAAAREFLARHRRITTLVHRAFRDFFAAAPAAAAAPVRIPTYTALKATGFTDPDPARQNRRLVLGGPPPLAGPPRRPPDRASRPGRPPARSVSRRGGSGDRSPLPGAARRALAESR